jgi:hypothetical protein
MSNINCKEMMFGLIKVWCLRVRESDSLAVTVLIREGVAA